MPDLSREALERLRKHLALLDEQAMTWTGHDYDISRLLALVEQQEKALAALTPERLFRVFWKLTIDANYAEMRAFAEKLNPDIGPMFGRDVVRALDSLLAERDEARRERNEYGEELHDRRSEVARAATAAEKAEAEVARLVADIRSVLDDPLCDGWTKARLCEMPAIRAPLSVPSGETR